MSGDQFIGVLLGLGIAVGVVVVVLIIMSAVYRRRTGVWPWQD